MRSGEIALVRIRRRDIAHHRAGAHDRDPVGHRHDFLQLVGDQQDRLALRFQAPKDLEQLLRLVGRQHTGRLIQDKDFGAAIERLQNLDPLAGPYRRSSTLASRSTARP